MVPSFTERINSQLQLPGCGKSSETIGGINGLGNTMKTLKPLILFLHQKRLLFIIPILLCLGLVFWSQSQKSKTIFPSKNHKFAIQTYSDTSEEGGKSVISPPRISDTGVTFEFTLQKNPTYSYAGLFISLMADSQFLDISKYKYLKLELAAENARSFSVYLKAFIDGVSKLDQFMTHEFLMNELRIDSVKSVYKINLDEFVHPAWWLEENNIALQTVKQPHFNKMISMQIQNGVFTPFNTPIKVSVTNVSFVKDNTVSLFIIFTLTILYFFAYLLVFMDVQRKNKAKQTVISYKELVVENDADKDLQRLQNSVAKHFADPEFTVEKLAREAGVSASRIPGILKERFNMNFKQYLNIIRITEAKRLLRETDNQITTCAYNVGYNNIPHFNRTFKQLEGVSPKEYRKNLKEGKPGTAIHPKP